MADQIAPGGGAHRPNISPVSRPYLAHISPVSRKVEALIATATDLESLQRYEDALRTGKLEG